MTHRERAAGRAETIPSPGKPEEGTDAVSGAASGNDPRRQFVVFAGVGTVATGVHYLLLIALVESGVAEPVAATAWGYLAGALVGYAANRRYTFASRVRHVVGLPRFMLVAAVGFVLNAALMAWMTGGPGIHYLPAQVVATALVLLWNFAANRHWTFGDTGRD